MKERIQQLIVEYQNCITEYFQLEVPMENDAQNMHDLLTNLEDDLINLL